eukprot:CAMPEP_0116882534 /NCGR_PEP_ID=MMETSP0463-20121206/14808_1 /TAXON_ID=181622 /ORGANISM="Strombidinopsis sp, Strain SopsisLIS2011" /LENGTH=56 /DNA_ID=CAMNT_0004535899 /DNA_START=9 /DNA_END=179 /DNA_ORIENTATION=+
MQVDQMSQVSLQGYMQAYLNNNGYFTRLFKILEKKNLGPSDKFLPIKKQALELVIK